MENVYTGGDDNFNIISFDPLLGRLRRYGKNGVWGCNAVIFGVCCRLCREYSDDVSGASCFSKANVSGNGETAPAVLHAARLCVHCLFCGVYRLYDRSRAFKLRKDFDRPASESAGRDLCMDGR